MATVLKCIRIHKHCVGTLKTNTLTAGRIFKQNYKSTICAAPQFVFNLMAIGKNHDNEPITEFILSSRAPVDTAAKLSQHFRELATKEKDRAKDLLAAGDYCEEAAGELLSLAAGKDDDDVSRLLRSVDHVGKPLLDVLIDCEQKEVVAHELVQQYLSNVWTGFLSSCSGLQMLLLFCAMLAVPPVWLALSLPLGHRFSQVPMIKFMSFLVSHLYLTALFILCTIFPPFNIWESADLVPHWNEWLLLAWLSGLAVSQLTNPEDRTGLGWIKVGVLALSVVGILVHLVAAPAFSVDDTKRLDCLFARNQFFAMALLLCFVQLMDFLSFHSVFGPWAIIIGELMVDLMRFLVVLAIFLVGFAFNIAAIYLPVYAPRPLDPNLGDGDGSGGVTARTVIGSVEMLFFSLFGMLDPENMPALSRAPWWSIPLLKSIVGLYLIITFIVLINLLIAMMSDTYEKIQEESDTEWKFGRAKLFRNMNKTPSTPSPLNLLTKLFVYVKVVFKHRGTSGYLYYLIFVAPIINLIYRACVILTHHGSL